MGVKIGRTLLIVAVLGATFFFGWSKQPAEMGIMAALGLVLLAFSNLEQFTSFKGAGFEAQMRETKAVTEDTKYALKQLQSMSLLISELMSEVVSRSGRPDSNFSTEETLDYRKKILKALTDMGIDKTDAQKATSNITNYDFYDLYNSFLQVLEEESNPENRRSMTEDITSLKASPDNVPSIEALINLANKHDVYKDDVKKAIDRIKNYRENKAFLE